VRAVLESLGSDEKLKAAFAAGAKEADEFLVKPPF
jgi:hypothetical protein